MEGRRGSFESCGEIDVLGIAPGMKNAEIGVSAMAQSVVGFPLTRKMMKKTLKRSQKFWVGWHVP
jgi:hypothetical protein